MTALHQRRWKIAAVALVLMVSSTIGCGRKGPPGMLWVTGTVLYEGQPLPEGAVHFLAQGKGSVGSSGSSRLSNSRYGLYLAPGEYAVAIISQEGLPEMDMKTGRETPAKSTRLLRHRGSRRRLTTATARLISASHRDGAEPAAMREQFFSIPVAARFHLGVLRRSESAR
jgi:hypothetical protein